MSFHYTFIRAKLTEARAVCGLHSARKVDIRLLIVYYWMALVAVGPLFLFGIACIDLKEVLRGWIDHRWNTQEFGWMRQFCCEEGTWDTKCTVPVNGGIEEDSEASWCATHYEGDSDCGAIREAAESKLNIYMTWLLNFNGIVGLTQVSERALMKILAMNPRNGYRWMQTLQTL